MKSARELLDDAREIIDLAQTEMHLFVHRAAAQHELDHTIGRWRAEHKQWEEWADTPAENIEEARPFASTPDDAATAMLEDLHVRLGRVEAQAKEALWRLGIAPGKTDLASWSETAGLPVGLCGNKEPHAPHVQATGSLAPFWCGADQSTRLPYAAEIRRRVGNKDFVCANCGAPATIEHVKCELILTPEEWGERKGIQIADPDGWRARIFNLGGQEWHGPKDFSTPVTEFEFDMRCSISSVIARTRPATDKETKEWLG